MATEQQEQQQPQLPLGGLALYNLIPTTPAQDWIDRKAVDFKEKDNEARNLFVVTNVQNVRRFGRPLWERWLKVEWFEVHVIDERTLLVRLDRSRNIDKAVDHFRNVPDAALLGVKCNKPRDVLFRNLGYSPGPVAEQPHLEAEEGEESKNLEESKSLEEEEQPPNLEAPKNLAELLLSLSKEQSKMTDTLFGLLEANHYDHAQTLRQLVLSKQHGLALVLAAKRWVRVCECMGWRAENQPLTTVDV